jgi:hypothetical protein
MRLRGLHGNWACSPASGRVLLLAAFAVLCVFASAAHALVVTVDLGWGYNYGGAGTSVDLVSEYNLQVGSVVQILMFDSSEYPGSYPGQDASQNFVEVGNYTGDGLSSAPYTSGHVPGDTTAYHPLTYPDGHFIAASATVQQAPYLDDQGDVWYQVLLQFEVLGNYDSLYVRVFGQTDLHQQGYWASYWGVSDLQTSTNAVGTWFVGPLDEIRAANSNYFYVIPEQGTLGLMAVGAIGLVLRRRRRRSGS